MYKNFQKFWDKKWSNVGLIENNNFSLKVPKFINEKGLKLIDIGAGNGRDSLYFSSIGFDVNSFDFSINALNDLSNISKEKRLNINTILGNTIDFDFKTDCYDVVYACNSLHYFSKEDTIKIFKKIKKSLKKGGYIFVRVKSIDDTDFGKGEKLGENFYKNGDDIKHYFTLDFIKELFFDFEILEIQELQDIHNKIDGTTSINGFIDLVARKK
ncbi:MAG: class I SAM-dependent methyltransferase [Candidatus Gracilibacteria bacterium]|nr:class I SAM-dependent methyltransferase [Candidatus Gracilibacteria bacterium]